MNAKVLFVGCDKGSWQMRGRQLGAELRARYASKPHEADWAWPDVIVLVKRAIDVWWREAKASGRPIVWDILDYWHQPAGNRKTEAELLREILQWRDILQIRTLIGATQAMATAIGGVYLPHHHRIGLEPSPLRPQMKVVAYEGSPRYLGSWRDEIVHACDALGLGFLINPPDMGQVDLIVAFRGEEWDGWPCRQWKSGIKYVNAIRAGRPVITQPCAAFEEIKPAGLAIETPSELVAAMRHFVPLERRQAVLRQSQKRATEFSIDRIARRYETLLESIAQRAA